MRFALAAKSVSWVVFVWLLLAAPGSSQGELITFQFGGRIDGIYDPDGVWAGRLQAGDPFMGSYTFDSLAQDALPLDPQLGRYLLTGGGMSVTLGGLSIAAPGEEGNILVDNGSYHGEDWYLAGAFSFESAGLKIGELDLVLTDTTGRVLTGDQLPLTPPSLSLFTTARFLMNGSDASTSHRFSLGGSVTYFVPEPQSMVFVLSGVLVLLRRLPRKTM